MRTLLHSNRKVQIALLGALLVVGALWAFGATRSRAANTSLWTEGKPTVGTAASPWVAVAKEDLPAVVNISTTQVVQNPMAQGGQGMNPGDPFQQFFQQYFGNMPRTLRQHSLGSGFIIRSDGYIVTNNHVVDHATEIKVKLSDGREFVAKVVGRDPKTDIALLRVNATGLPILQIGDSRELQVGQPVMAIGNPFGLTGTVTTGIVSAEGRVIGEGPYDNFIQTDASINPGNSGGPLVDQSGEVVGINTAIFSQSGGSVGIGFAIPIDMAKIVLPQLEAQGHVTRGWLGVSIQPVTEDIAKALQLPKPEGALVAQVLPDSPASKAGVQPGDVITSFDGHPVAKAGELPRLVADTKVGSTATLQVIRNDKPLTLSLQIAEMPGNPQEAAPTTAPKESLGLTVEPLTPALANQLGVPDKTGVVVARVQDGSPAADAGIQPGDVIVQANRQPVKGVADLRRAINERKPGEAILFLIHRHDASLFVAVTQPTTPQG
jgi:serine protease Do